MKHSAQGPGNEGQENNPSGPNQSKQMEPPPSSLSEHKNLSSMKLEMLGKGVITAVAASVIVQTGRTVGSKLIKNPVFLFSLGMASGFMLRKYRKKIIAKADCAAEHTREFMLHQKEKLMAMVADESDE